MLWESIWNKLRRHCNFAVSLLIVSYAQDTLRKGLSHFVERFKTIHLESLSHKFCQYMELELLKHCIFVELLLVEG